jgi:hypothetical protein
VLDGLSAGAATELRDKGTYGYLASSAAGRQAIQHALGAADHGGSSHGDGEQQVK